MKQTQITVPDHILKKIEKVFADSLDVSLEQAVSVGLLLSMNTQWLDANYIDLETMSIVQDPNANTVRVGEAEYV